MNRYILTNKKTKKEKHITARSNYDAKWLAAKSKKKINEWALELYVDHDKLQQEGIIILGYRTFAKVPTDREEVAQINKQLKLIGQSIHNFKDLEGLPILVKLTKVANT